MTDETGILHTINEINDISNNTHLNFKEKLQNILSHILSYMGSQKGSIMIVKNAEEFQIAASTNPNLVGLTMPLQSESPSSWVYENKKPLYNDDSYKNGHCQPSSNPERYSKNAFIISPIILNDKVMGVMSITEKSGEDKFSRYEQNALLGLSGQVIGALEINKLAENLKKKSAVLKKRNTELKRLQKIRDDFTNMLVHDLKGPISEITANLDILSYTTEGDNLEYVKSAQTGCDTLFYMTSNLLDIARLEEGNLVIIEEKIDAGELIAEAISRVFVQAKFRTIELLQETPENTPCTILGDRGMLLRIFQNLIINAINYSPVQDSIHIGFTAPTEKEVSFFVRDHGPGIPDEFADKIFEKFTRVSETNATRSHSVGLGLTFCKAAAEAHGGKVYVDFSVTDGCCFKLDLPVSP